MIGTQKTLLPISVTLCHNHKKANQTLPPFQSHPQYTRISLVLVKRTKMVVMLMSMVYLEANYHWHCTVDADDRAYFIGTLSHQV